jgi:SAM-dependent methyltransferase
MHACPGGLASEAEGSGCQASFFYPLQMQGHMDWAENIFVRNAKLYEHVLEGMWERGEEDAVAISSYLGRAGLGDAQVLDVPCGIGRLAVPLARLGFRVTGVDLSRHLISVAGAKARAHASAAARTRFFVGDMRDLRSRFPPDSFDVVLNVFTSIGYGSEKDDLEFFREARAVTKVGGLFLISGLRNRNYVARNPSQNIYEESGKILVLDTYKFDSDRSREEGTWRFYLKKSGGKKGGELLRFAGEFPIDIRIYSPHELISRLNATGWGVTETLDSFISMGAYREDSPVYALVAKAE